MCTKIRGKVLYDIGDRRAFESTLAPNLKHSKSNLGLLTATEENDLEAKDNKLRTMNPSPQGMNLMKINSAIFGHLGKCAYQTNIGA